MVCIKWYEKDAFIISFFSSRKKIPLTSFINGPKPKWSKLKINDLKDFVNRLDSDSEKYNASVPLEFHLPP